MDSCNRPLVIVDAVPSQVPSFGLIPNRSLYYRTEWYLVFGCLVFGRLVFGCLLCGCMVFGCLVRRCLVCGCLVFGCLVLGCLAFGCLVFGCLVCGCLVFGCLVLGCPVSDGALVSGPLGQLRQKTKINYSFLSTPFLLLQCTCIHPPYNVALIASDLWPQREWCSPERVQPHRTLNLARPPDEFLGMKMCWGVTGSVDSNNRLIEAGRTRMHYLVWYCGIAVRTGFLGGARGDKIQLSAYAFWYIMNTLRIYDL